jgi:hypothetical protein
MRDRIRTGACCETDKRIRSNETGDVCRDNYRGHARAAIEAYEKAIADPSGSLEG